MEPTKAYLELCARELRDEAQAYRMIACDSSGFAWLSPALAQACAEALEEQASARAAQAQAYQSPSLLRILR